VIRRRRRWPFPPIVAGFFVAGAVLTALTAFLLVAHLQAGALLAYLLAVNLVTFGAYLYDKSVARGELPLWRVPEATLHLLALAGGTPAAIAAQQRLRHKTQKPSFRNWTWLIIAIQIAGIAAFLILS